MKKRVCFMKLSRKILFSTLIALAPLSFLTFSYLKPKTVTRAAIDVGSGSIKVTVAKVDPLKQKIHTILYSKEHPVPFKHDLQVGGKSELSEKVQKVAIETLSNLREELAMHNAVEWKGIATAASRQAKNAQELFDHISENLNMHISIISQNEEGRVGFGTAAAVSNAPIDKIIAVDSGSGSFQITTLVGENLEVIEGDLGYIPSLEMLMEIRGQKLEHNATIEPVTLEEAVILVQKLKEKMPESTDVLKAKLQDPEVQIIGIGNENFIFGMSAIAVGKDHFTKEELWDAINAYAGKPASEMTQFAKPSTTVLGMVLLYSIMDAMELNELTSCYANGSCEGVLVDADYWTKSEIA